MINGRLLRLLGDKKKYIVYSVLLQITGLFANLTVTAALCCAIERAVHYANYGKSILVFRLPAILAVAGMVVRYLTTRLAGECKDTLGRGVKKDLRKLVYAKLLRLGEGITENLSMAGMTQVAIEGIEQLDLYYSSYIPQFFYAMLAPLILFCVTVWLDWYVALVLLACVPLIPVLIVAVSKYAKKIFAKYWGQYTSMGDSFLDSVQGMKELKIFRADDAWHVKMNEKSEEFRKITMRVLVMQLASTTIMDLVAYGGAGLGIALALFGAINRGLSPFTALFLMLVAVDFFLPLHAFGSAFHVAMNGASAGDKILSLLEQPELVWGQAKPEGRSLRLEEVTFSYDGTREVLKQVSMDFPETGMTAMVGKSGCGKSTVVRLLSGTCRPQNGRVLAGKRPLEELSRESYYDCLAVVSYNTYLFHETLRDNFKLAKKQLQMRKSTQHWNR